MFDRYLDNPEATEETFVTIGDQKWFKTGDVAIQPEESEGSYKIMGRLSQDIIKKQGYKLSAIEIESALFDHEAVSQVAVVGVPDEKFGEEVVAFVVLRDPSANKEQVRDSLDKYARDKMSNYKVPRVYNFIEEMPRNHMGKILRA